MTNSQPRTPEAIVCLLLAMAGGFILAVIAFH